MDWHDFALRLVVAICVGLLIGIERHMRRKIAGLRVNTLVAMGSAIYCMVVAGPNDPSGTGRVVAQVASGIGFLGAGVIIRDGLNIRGLDTAATLWCTAAAGALAGTGQYKESALAGLAIVIINIFLRYFQGNGVNAEPNVSSFRYEVHFSCTVDQVASLKTALLNATWGVDGGNRRNNEIVMESMSATPTALPGEWNVVAIVEALNRCDIQIETQVHQIQTTHDLSRGGWYCLSGLTTNDKNGHDGNGKVFPPSH